MIYVVILQKNKYVIQFSNFVILSFFFDCGKEKYVVELEKMTFNFLWKGKPDRIKRVTVVNSYEKGGLKAPKISIFWDSLKLSWTRRLLTSGGIWQKILQLNLLQANYE